MADLTITNTFVANTLARASEVNTNFNDGKNYINARNQGTTGWDHITLATSGLLTLPTGGTALAPTQTWAGDLNTGHFYVASDTLGWTTGGTERLRLSTSVLQSTLPLTLTPTSNQIVLGTTNTTTISATAPAASRTYTFPDVLNSANVILSEGTQTINGTKTFGSAPTAPSLNLTNTTNQLVLGTTNTYTVNATAPAASRVITLSDPGASASFIMSEGTQTINGSKTFGSAPTAPSANLTNTTNQLVLGTTNTYTINATAPAASRVITLADPGAAASFVMTEGTQTINGAKTFSSIITGTAGITTNTSLTLSQSASGTALTSLIDNTSNTASSEAVLITRVAGSSAGDSYHLFTITGATSVSLGLDNSDSDAFVISANATLGTTNGVRMNATTGAVAIRGTTTNDSATTGFVGETVSSVVSTPTNFPATTQLGDLTSISLTAGDWLVSVLVRTDSSTATVTDAAIGISTTSGNSATGLTFGDNRTSLYMGVTLTSFGAAIASYRVSLTGTTTH